MARSDLRSTEALIKEWTIPERTPDLIGGGTEWAIDFAATGHVPTSPLYLADYPLSTVKLSRSTVVIGAACSLMLVDRALRGSSEPLAQVMHEMIAGHRSVQLSNQWSAGGALMQNKPHCLPWHIVSNGRPLPSRYSDLAALLIAIGATVEFVTRNGLLKQAPVRAIFEDHLSEILILRIHCPLVPIVSFQHLRLGASQAQVGLALGIARGRRMRAHATFGVTGFFDRPTAIRIALGIRPDQSDEIGSALGACDARMGHWTRDDSESMVGAMMAMVRAAQ